VDIEIENDYNLTNEKIRTCRSNQGKLKKKKNRNSVQELCNVEN